MQIRKKNIDIILFAHICIVCIIFYASKNPLSPDEAHYVQWSRNLDFSYYSKGPLLALAVYISTHLFGESEYAVRFPALFFTVTTFCFVYFFLKKKYNSKDLSCIYVVIASTVSFLYPALLMTTDAPVLFFWVTSVYYLSAYLERRDSYINLILGLMLLGFGIWTKYTILSVLITFVILLFVANKSTKRLLAELLIIASIILGFLSPIIYWNYMHEWVNISHNASHAGSGLSKGIRISYFFDFLGSQLGVYGIFFFLILKDVFRRIKLREVDSLLPIVSSALLFLICILVSFTKRIYPNWTIPAFLVLLMYHSSYVIELYNRHRKLYRLSLGLNVCILLLGVFLLCGITFGVKGDILPTKKLVGWREFTSKVRELKDIYSDATLIVTDSYDITAELGYYASDITVYNAALGGRRMNQYDIWEERRKSVARIENHPVLLILGDMKNIELFRDYFTEIDPITPLPYFSYDFNGAKIRTLNAYIAYGYSGKDFPKPIGR